MPIDDDLIFFDFCGEGFFKVIGGLLFAGCSSYRYSYCYETVF